MSFGDRARSFTARIARSEHRRRCTSCITPSTSILVATLLVVLATSGCTWATFNSIHRTFDLGGAEAKGHSVDAKQRIIITKTMVAQPEDPNAAATNDHSGRVVSCAEPSPDALQVLGIALAAEVAEPQSKINAKGAATSAEGALSIGLRTQTIQLLRDGMYRLCESYFNSAIDGPSYKAAHLRYQDSMVALLAIEQLTGATRPEFASINGNSNSRAGSSTANSGNGTGETSEGTDPKSKSSTESPGVVSASANVRPGESSESDATDGSSAKQQAAVADAVKEIVKLVLEKDYSLQFCLDYLRSKQAEANKLSGQTSVINACEKVIIDQMARPTQHRADAVRR